MAYCSCSGARAASRHGRLAIEGCEDHPANLVGSRRGLTPVEVVHRVHGSEQTWTTLFGVNTVSRQPSLECWTLCVRCAIVNVVWWEEFGSRVNRDYLPHLPCRHLPSSDRRAIVATPTCPPFSTPHTLS